MPEPPPSLRVLAVDDHPDAADSLALLVRTWGHEAVAAYNGDSALEQAGRFCPHVVILDLVMPGMNGYELAAALRRVSGVEGALLVCVSGVGGDEARRAARDKAFDHYFLKPVDPDELRRILESCRSASRPA